MNDLNSDNSSPFDVLPPELIIKILLHLEPNELKKALKVDKNFYNTITTGYKDFKEDQNKLGLDNYDKLLPTANHELFDKIIIDFGIPALKELKPANMPIFFFYRVMRKVKNLPSQFWPYLKNTCVHTLDLSNNQINNAGAGTIFKNLPHSIRILDLRCNELQELQNISSLQECTKLEKLYLSSSNINHEGAQAIFNNLPASIRILDLRDNELTGNLGDISYLQKCTKLEKLNLRFSKINNEGAQAIFKNLKHSIRILDLRGNELTGNLGDISSLQQCTKLEKLYLRDNQINNQGAGKIFENLPPSIRILYLNENNLEGIIPNISYLKQCTKLEKLYLRWTKINHKDAQEIFKYLPDSICELDLSYNTLQGIHQILEEDISSLKQCTKLEELYLSHTQINNQDAEVIFKNLPNSIRILDLRGNNIYINDEIQKALQEKYTMISIII